MEIKQVEMEKKQQIILKHHHQVGYLVEVEQKVKEEKVIIKVFAIQQH